jgi:hypothetical protein
MSNAEVFCAEFFRRAKNYALNYGSQQNFKLGSRNVNLYCNTKSRFGELISGAFLLNENIPNQTDFNLYVWDSSFPDILPDFSWAEEYIYSNLIIPYELTQPYRILFDRGQGMISVLNTENSESGIWMRDHSQLDPRCFVAPFRTLLSWIADTFNAEIIHASGIEINGQGILLSGPSGSGKSTMAIKVALRGHGIISDDAVLFENGNLSPVYSRAKIEKMNPFFAEHHLKTFELDQKFNSKQILPLSNFGEQFTQNTPLKFLVFPSLSDSSRLTKLENAEASELLIEQSTRELFGGLPSNKLRLTLLLKKYPSYKLELSGAIEEEVATLVNIGK